MADIDPTTLPRSRAEAQQAGAGRYYTGTPCIHGHLSQRVTRSAVCVICRNLGVLKWQEEHRDAHVAYLRDYHSRPAVKELKGVRIAVWRAKDPRRAWSCAAVSSAKRRAREAGLEFRLTYPDVLVLCLDRCPALGIDLDYGFKGGRRGALSNSPTIDRLDGARGYTPDNIAVISYRANTMKSDGTLAELRRIADWLETALG